jgi:NitT/TauT family transport system substrate-binding protein
MKQWDLFFKTAKTVGQTKLDIATSEYVLNDFIKDANDFDKAKVHADADNYKLPADMAEVDVAAIEAVFFANVTNKQ